MQIIRIGLEDTLMCALEDRVQTKNVRMTWIIAQDDADVPFIREALRREDYTVARGSRWLDNDKYFNTLVTSWSSYAADQNEYVEILPKLDIVVLDGMTELNQCAWMKWAENTGKAGWPMSDDITIILS